MAPTHMREAGLARDQSHNCTPFKQLSSQACISARDRHDPDSPTEQLQHTLPVSNSMKPTMTEHMISCTGRYPNTQLAS